MTRMAASGTMWRRRRATAGAPAPASRRSSSRPSPRRAIVDHTPYDTTSILRFITHRFGLPVLPGIAARDAGIAANGNPPLGDLTAALNLPAAD